MNLLTISLLCLTTSIIINIIQVIRNKRQKQFIEELLNELEKL